MAQVRYTDREMSPVKYEIAASPTPTLLLGMASAVDLFGSIGIAVKANLPDSVEEALALDWLAVYGDVDRAFGHVTEGVALP